MRRRNRAVTFRMTEEEYQLLLDQVERSGLTEQSFINNAISDAVILPPADLQELNQQLSDLSRQLRGIATNINQLTHLANAGQAFPALEKLQEIQNLIIEFRRELENQWRSIRQLTAGQKPMLQ